MVLLAALTILGSQQGPSPSIVPLVTPTLQEGDVRVTGEGSTTAILVSAKGRATTKFASAVVELNPVPDSPCRLTMKVRFGAAGKGSSIRFDIGGETLDVGATRDKWVLSQMGGPAVILSRNSTWGILEIRYNGASAAVSIAGMDALTIRTSEPPKGFIVGCFSEYLGLQQEVEVREIKCIPTGVKLSSRATREPIVLGTRSDGPTIYKACKDSVVTVFVETSSGLSRGSGFYIAPDLIVTNYHVVAGARQIVIRSASGALMSSPIAFRADPVADLCILSVPPPAAGSPLVLAKQSPVVGEHVFVIGSPRGYESSLSEGLISAEREFDGVPHVQFTAPISPGSSGGPMINTLGEVVGVVRLKRVDADSLYFGITATMIPALLNQRERDFGSVVP